MKFISLFYIMGGRTIPYRKLVYSMTSKKEIMAYLKQEILSLELKPGAMISETALSERFQLSRTPIRDVLKQLSLEQYVDIYPKKGNLVSYIDLESVEQIIYLRNVLEKEIMKSLAGNIPLKGLHELRDNLAQQQKCIEQAEGRRYSCSSMTSSTARCSGWPGVSSCGVCSSSSMYTTSATASCIC